jgi:hypothetical protein
MLKHMELKCIKKCAHLKLKSKFCNKICTSEDERGTYQAKRKLSSRDTPRHPNIDRNGNVGTLTAIGIVPTTKNVEQKSALASSAPAIATERATIATMSLKS